MYLAIPSYIGNYVMDLEGNIYSLERRIRNSLGRVYIYPPKLIKPIVHSTGYNVVRLYKNGNAKTFRYHRLVAEVLLDNPDNKEFVNHKDGDKRNNSPHNLEWVTPRENYLHAVDIGLFPKLRRDSINGRFLAGGKQYENTRTKIYV